MRKTAALALALPLTVLLAGGHTPAEARRVSPTPTPSSTKTVTPTPTLTVAPTQAPTTTGTPVGPAAPTGTVAPVASATAAASATPSTAPTASPSPSPSSGYNGAAAAYADQYWSAYNPQWPSYANSGGDCTNFVSQSLYAGGIAMRTNPPYSGTAAWFMLGAPANPNPSTS